MSGLQRAIRHPDRLNDPHARARELASEALLGPLTETDADWLGDHLAGCGPCRAAADAFAADAAVLRGLRDDVPPVPRDLGARVSLALDDEVRRAMRPSLARRAMGWGTGGGTSIRRPGLAFVGLAALAMVALLVGPLALPAGTLPAGTSPAGSLLPAATPITVDTDVAWVRRSSDGTYVISSAQVGQVCPGVDASACGTLDGSARTLAALQDKPTSVVLQRDRTQAVVVGQDTVYAVAVNSPPPVTTPGPDTSPVPTKAPVQTPAATGEPASPPADSPSPSGSPASPVPTESPTATPPATAAPPSPSPEVSPAPASPSPGATAAPASPSPEVSPAPASPSPAVSPPPASPSPEATPPPSSPEPPATVEPATPPPTLPPPTPAPTAATAVAIAEKVVLVGSPPSYSPDGSWVAFSARPDDGSHGPDVYAWHVGDAKARAVTDDHASVFSGWLGSAILASAARSAQPADAGRKAVAPPSDADPANVVARSFLVDPATRDINDIRRDGVWRPVVDPTSRLVVFWTGTLAWDDAARAWLPADGRLVADRWQDVLEGTKEPAARRLPADAAGAAISDWEVRFDPAGRRLAAWVADPAMPGTGRLALVAVADNGTLGAVLFGDAAALPGFSLEVDRIAWSTPPGRNGQGSLVAVYAWRGDAAGQMYSLPDPGNEPVVVVH